MACSVTIRCTFRIAQWQYQRWNTEKWNWNWKWEQFWEQRRHARARLRYACYTVRNSDLKLKHTLTQIDKIRLAYVWADMLSVSVWGFLLGRFEFDFNSCEDTHGSSLLLRCCCCFSFYDINITNSFSRLIECSCICVRLLLLVQIDDLDWSVHISSNKFIIIWNDYLIVAVLADFVSFLQ